VNNIVVKLLVQNLSNPYGLKSFSIFIESDALFCS